MPEEGLARIVASVMGRGREITRRKGGTSDMISTRLASLGKEQEGGLCAHLIQQ